MGTIELPCDGQGPMTGTSHLPEEFPPMPFSGSREINLVELEQVCPEQWKLALSPDQLNN